jgi:hemolysin III
MVTIVETGGYSFREEVANAVTHGIGALLSIAGLVALVVISVSSGDKWMIVSSSVYGSTLILMFLASTFYHSIPAQRAKRILKVLDHSAIYLLIAGTYTVFTLGPLRGPWGYSIFAVVWVLALAGIIFKIFFTGRFRALSITLYLLMGWIVIIALPPLVKALTTESLIWLVAGGLAYSLGTIFYGFKRIPFNHAIWHLFVLAGSVFHFIAVLKCIN